MKLSALGDEADGESKHYLALGEYHRNLGMAPTTPFQGQNKKIVGQPTPPTLPRWLINK